MLKLSVTLENIDYEGTIDTLFPIVFKNKLVAGASKNVAKTALKNKTQTEKDAFVASFLNQYSDQIIKYLQNEISLYGLSIKVKGINAAFE